MSFDNTSITKGLVGRLYVFTVVTATLNKLAYGCCTKPLMTYMSKSAQKINFTHLSKLFKKKQDYTIKFWYEY